MIWSEQNAWKRWFHLTWFRFCPLMGSRDSGPKWAVGGKSSNRRQNPTNTSSWHRDWWIGSSIWTFGSWWWWRNCTIQLDATDISHRMFCWFVMVGQWVTESLFGTKFVSNKWSYSGIQSKQYCLKLKKKTRKLSSLLDRKCSNYLWSTPLASVSANSRVDEDSFEVISRWFNNRITSSHVFFTIQKSALMIQLQYLDSL